jgi:predicted Rossmann fold flavoprotein
MAYKDVIIIGGGAAGFFAAINLAEKHPNLSIAILEKGKEVLQKVRISGGGRCNVTHACFEPKALSKFYPRGEKELISPFHQFCAGDTVAWFEQRGVELKIEDDGRMFPVSNSSETIVNCLTKNALVNKVSVLLNTRVDEILPPNETQANWKLKCGENYFQCAKLIIASGSNPKMWELLKNLGHDVVEPVPSLFTFNIKDERVKDLMGLSVPNTQVQVEGQKLQANGPLLITHWGMSGPGILRLSAWGAVKLHELKYNFSINVNWVYPNTPEMVKEKLEQSKKEFSKQKIFNTPVYALPKRLWHKMILASNINEEKKWADISKIEMANLLNEISSATFKVNGKSTFKDEFVTAGGIDLKEVNMKTFESKIHPNLFFAGEVLNIDAITGGFNFQAAWTGGWIVSENV